MLFTQHWQRFRQPHLKPKNWPPSRQCHAAVMISDVHVMVVGGRDKHYNNIADSWLFNIDTTTWTKVSYWSSCDLTLTQSDLLSMI